MSVTEPARQREGMSFVGALPIVQLMPEALRELVTESFEERSYGFGEYLVTEGEESDGFYVVTEGLVRVVTTGPDGAEMTVDMMRPGESFGESGLLDDLPRTRSVRASTPAAAARLDRSVFRAMVRLHPQVKEVFELQARARRLQGFLRLHVGFSSLPTEAVAELLRVGREVRLSAGEQHIAEGDMAENWWVVEDGRLTVYHPQPARREIRFLRTGDIYGELALRQATPRTASVEATTAVLLLEFPGEAFHRLLEYPEFRARVDERLAMYERADRGTADLAPEPEGEVALGADELAVRQATAGVELTEAVDEEAPQRKMPRRFPWVRQIDEADCGAACVAMLCRAFGERVSLNFIRRAVGTGQQGTSLRGIKQGGEQIGLAMKATKTSVDRLRALPLPAIVHWDGNHWVVLYRIEAGRVHIADPARGTRKVDLPELEQRWSGYTATAAPTERLAEAPREKIDLRWLRPFLAPQRKRLILAVLLALVAAGLQMLPPVLSQNVIDSLLEGRGAGRVNALIAFMVAVLLVALAASMLMRRVLARAAVEIDSASLDFVTGRLLDLPLSYFESRRTGDVERRLNGLRELRQIVVGSFPTVMAGAVQLVVTLVIMFTFSWVIGLAFLATAPAYALLMHASATRLKPTFDELEEAYGRHASKQIDAIKGIAAVKTAGAETAMRGRILREFTQLAGKVFRADFVMMSYDAAVQLTGFLIFVLFLWIAALLAISGTLTVGQVVAVNSLVLLANGPILGLLGFWDQLQMGAVLLLRLQDVLDEDVEQPEGDDALHPVRSLGGRLALRQLGLVYRDAPNRPALAGVSLELEPGMSLGLVGRSGSGKSTLLRCLAGLLAPTSGAIEYDGVDLRQLRWSELRRRIGFVLQEPYLFDDTIAANIALGEEDPDWGRVYRAAEMADVAGFVEDLALGYMTRVGDSGMRLSGGQAQRVAIARALYHEPPVLLFDEATSALDTEAERAVKENLDRVMAGRTAVIVAHRLSTIRDADVIGVLERGHLVEWGSHEELMAREGLYFHLNMVQVEQ